MPANKVYPSPTFEQAFSRARGYQVSTPYAMISIAEDGRKITIELWPDVRQSIHHKALFSYYQQLTRKGVLQINVDHLDIAGLDKSLDLKRGKAKLDMVYIHRSQLHEVELKTHREVGLDVTRLQLMELVKHCSNLIIVVPRRDMENMRTILTMLKLQDKAKVDCYEILEEEGEQNDDTTT
jgi:hypothetical protein